MIILGVACCVLAIFPMVLGVRDETKRTLLGVGILLLGIGSVFIVLSSLTATVETEYKTYSKYGFSFEYPSGESQGRNGEPPTGITSTVFVISESGLLSRIADETSGMVAGLVEKPRYTEGFTISWETMQRAPEIEGRLDSVFGETEGLTGEVEKLIRLEGARVSGYPVQAQAYKLQHRTLEGSGILGVWYCERKGRLYTLDILRTGIDASDWATPKGVKEYKRYLNSFAC